MPRQVGSAVENNFSKGLITEATGMTFPENAVTDALNVRFDQTGYVERRLGIEFENGYVPISYTLNDGVVRTFLWRAVALSGTNVFLVIQRGDFVSFFVLANNGGLSAGLRAETVDLTSYLAPGAGNVQNQPCDFASGLGRLFITNPKTDPIVVTYNDRTDTLSAARITVKIRDLKGVDDGLAPDTEPGNLTSAHYYNLKNQGWYQQVRVGSRNTG